MPRWRKLLLVLPFVCLCALAQVNPQLFAGLNWRLIGPWRGGKATSVMGVEGQPAIYYMGTAGSGAWKTSDGARTWQCITDGVRLTGIGAVAVAQHQPNLVYVGASGQGERNGLYRSTDAGATFQLVALDGHAVDAIVINARDPNLALAASPDVGVVRTTDGGRTWTEVITAAKAGGGGVALSTAPDDPRIVYAGLRAPFRFAGRGTAPTPTSDPPIYRSTDGGKTWSSTTDTGLPPRARGTMGLSVAPGHHGKTLYSYVAQGVFVSSDAGDHWRQATTDPRLIGGGQFHGIYVDPTNDTVLYATQTSAYRSTDAGKTWQSFTGAPSGDDFNAFWMDPTHPLDMALAVDQGTEVSMNGGHTWTTWYNQPTGQMYNVSVDHRFPFHMYASQQDSGTVAVPIRGQGGEITYRDWYTTNGFESARITPDPFDADLLYATGWYGSILRINHRTGQTVHVFERSPEYREAGSPSMEFSPEDPHTLYLATQYVLKTTDQGQHWDPVSPDLTVGSSTAPASPAGRGGAAISTLAPSPVSGQVLWAGTSNGLVQFTEDAGATWQNVTPPGLHGAVAMVAAGSMSAATAYVTAGGRGGSQTAQVYRTNDNGKIWTAIAQGLPAGAVHAIREDSVNPNLLFAAMDSGVFVSFNNGDAWQSLELNLPNASCRDLQIEQNDLVLATFGRGLWSLDDIGSLRQMSSETVVAGPVLFAPTPAIRMQWDGYTDTPLNPETPHSANPPDGAILDYYLPAASSQLVKLAVYDEHDNLIHEFSSLGPAKLPYKVNVPDYWLEPPVLLPNHAGLNRFVWNLRYPDPHYLLYTYFGIHTTYFEYTLADHAIPNATPWHEPQGPMVVPGQYQVKLTVDGKTYTQPLTVHIDPRLTNVTASDLQTQLHLSQELVAGLNDSTQGFGFTSSITDQSVSSSKDAGKIATDLGQMNRDMARILAGLNEADAAPGTEVSHAVAALCQQYNLAAATWNKVASSVALSLPIHACDE